MEIKVQCGCGQKFKFDIEPVNGQMPFAVNCPSCGADGTAEANAMLAQSAPPPPPPVPAGVGALRLNRPAPAASAAVAEPTRQPVPTRATASRQRAAADFKLGMGIAGALAGAAVGSGAMYGFFRMAGFRFPLLGVGIGALTGFGAKWLARGTDNLLGITAGVIALLSVAGTLYLMYGDFPMMNIISAVVSVSIAYRIASA
jgi:hypothetical protein